MTPRSSYDLPCHSPFQMIGLPSFHSDITVVPNMYSLMASGVMSAFHTSAMGASTVTEALATNFLSMDRVLLGRASRALVCFNKGSKFAVITRCSGHRCRNSKFEDRRQRIENWYAGGDTARNRDCVVV